MIKGVFFDFNGCLLDDRGLTFKSVQEVCRAFKISKLPTFEEWRRSIGSNYMDFYRKAGVDSGVMQNVLNEVRNGYIFLHWNDAQLRPDAETIIRRCKAEGLKIAIVSAETGSLLLKRIREAGLEDLFDLIYTDASPKKLYLDQALQALNLSPEEVVFIEDTAEGVRAGNEVGLITVGFVNDTSYGFHDDIRKAKPRWTIAELSEIFVVINYVNLVNKVYPGYLEGR